MTVPLPDPVSPRLPRPLGRWSLLILPLALAVGLLALLQPMLAGAAGVAVLALSILVQLGGRLPAAALRLIGLCLVGYAFLGKGFAYLGVPPVFIGEMALGTGLAALAVAWRQGARLRHVGILCALLAIFALISLGATLPSVGPYGLDALRDAATWYYALFAVIVALLVVHGSALYGAVQQYGRVLPYFMLLAPILFWVSGVTEDSLPKWPISGQNIIGLKGGDLAVHLAGAMAFMLLGLHHSRAADGGRQPASSGSQWWWWLLWSAAFAGLLTGRSALVTVAVPMLFVLLLRPLSRWGRPLLILLTALALVLVVDPRVTLGSGRELSIDGVLLGLQSITGSTGADLVDGTRTWRLDWWNTIWSYTVNGEYFWTGKGYGINLATADGFQVSETESLRNPHSIHFSVLARSGVPGLLSWIALNLVFALSLLRAFWQARVRGQLMWANIHLWILAYWLAFMVNASFDVYIEGPQGGIWFWSVMGLGIAALELYRREERA